MANEGKGVTIMKQAHTGRRIIVILLLLIALAGGAAAYYITGIGAVSKDGEDVIFTVADGSTANSVISDLDEAGLIRSELAARIYVKIHKPALIQNTYKLNTSMSLDRMFTIMENAESDYVINTKLTITEGGTIPDAAKSVGEILNMTKKEVIAAWADETYIKTLCNDYWFMDADTLLDDDILYPLEGYFYPETYYINSSEPTLDDITRTMLDQMDEALTERKDKIEAMDFSVHEFLTLGSIVAAESLYEDDMPKIAGVFINRMNKDMKLQSDVTVNYGLQRTGVKLTAKMLKSKSKYNTYKYKGLPVGPIGTVQETVMDAVLNYTKHDYYYFFAKEDGTVIYSETYEEHQAAVEKYKWY